MKELSVEEKAKCYDSMFERLKEMYNNNKTNVAARLICERYFPELKESDNKRMIQYFKDLAPFDKAGELYEKYGFSHKDAIAWLEKQAEHANFRNKIQIGDKVTRNKDGVLVNLSQLNRVAKKQGEQKPADKVEPKFREGDWVVYCNDDVDLITGIEENGYCINNGGYIPFVCENEMRLWDITDAKVGDVLVSESTCGLGTWYCIFKSLDGDESMTVYCYLARDGRFETKKELCFDKDPYNTKPATKEQCDTLMKAMADAGYKWNNDKKELKKIEQKFSECIQETIPNGGIVWEDFNEGDGNYKVSLAYLSKSQVELIENLVASWQNPTNNTTDWSKEDERMLNLIVQDYEAASKSFCGHQGKLDWLKSLKERVQPQNTWKPSDEQIEALESATENCAYSEYQDCLRELIGQLKKLREE